MNWTLEFNYDFLFQYSIFILYLLLIWKLKISSFISKYNIDVYLCMCVCIYIYTYISWEEVLNLINSARNAAEIFTVIHLCVNNSANRRMNKSERNGTKSHKSLKHFSHFLLHYSFSYEFIWNIYDSFITSVIFNGTLYRCSSIAERIALTIGDDDGIDQETNIVRRDDFSMKKTSPIPGLIHRVPSGQFFHARRASTA